MRESDAARAVIVVTQRFEELRKDEETLAELAQRLGPDDMRTELERQLGPGVLIG